MFPKLKSVLQNKLGKNCHEKPLVISNIFGTSFKTLYPAPVGYRSVLFSNNPELKAEATLKGWEFRLVLSDGMDLSEDETVSSVQSKYIKFLMFESEFPEYFKGQPILYVDHKVELKKNHILHVKQLLSREKAILIRNTPRIKTTISQEVDDALTFLRYSQSMPQTLNWVDLMKKDRNARESVRIVNTGLIYYADYSQVRELLNEVYQVIKSLNQPECQIIWAVLSQPYERIIQRVDWSEIGIDHRLP